ncbi:hypothetical protein M409DRAFT_22339 [Zasmidium cellare ATCC 36951]|uniref:Uncharacterized protein n=1 Tax=Zasmidium cellare ATCC 36951 TaxID=1080233 RepID=A0A6A6CNN7_ZASCE|nr:uncharacterized protein M409DRAFT_22339 [Zasmidium cellare ATCC 36951]KAF2167532.1 hypothetical protein M409DRAFT_22339 [Zasmidium cellare ATCC 36951]
MADRQHAQSPSSSLLSPSATQNYVDHDRSIPRSRIVLSDSTAYEPSLEQYEPKQQWRDAAEKNPFKLWWMEMLSIMVSLACLGANIAFLVALDNQEYKSWKIAKANITPNTVISIIATFTKASLLLPVAEVLSQLKWLYFQARIQRLSDLQVFDDASRGPLGSLKLLWKVNRHSAVASMGAILTVLALALEPFTQQVIRYPTKQAPTTNVTALIGATQAFDPSAFAGSANGIVLKANEVQQLTAAIDSAIIRKAPDAMFTCPSGSCTWPGFSSLGLCNEYQNISSVVNVTCENKGSDVSKNSTYHLCNYTAVDGSYGNPQVDPNYSIFDQPGLLIGWTLWATKGDGIYRSSTQMNISQDQSLDTRDPMFDILYFQDSYTSDDPNAPQSIMPETLRSRLTWCARYYGSTAFYNGSLHDAPDFSAPLVSDGGAYGAIQPDTSNLTSYEIMLLNATDNTYQIDGDFSEIFRNLLNSMLVNVVYHNDSDVTNLDVFQEMLPTEYFQEFFQTGPVQGNNEYLKGVAIYYASNGSILDTFDNIATSVTNQMRSSYASTNITGTVTQTVVYVHVVWPWLIYSITMTLLAAALLGATMWLSSGKDKLVWKSSSLATLFHGLPDGQADGRMLRRVTMEKAAGLMLARLETDEVGAVKLKLL